MPASDPRAGEVPVTSQMDPDPALDPNVAEPEPEPVDVTAPMPEEERHLLDPSYQWLDRWNEIQTGFVDEPRKAIESADALVAEILRKLTDTFAAERVRLESQWNEGAEPSTEDMRVALQRYRSFFNRLLAAA